MRTLIDSSLWVDFTRARSPSALKRFILPYILSPGASLAEPIAFEVLRHATDQEAKQVQLQFQSMPMLATPADLWAAAAKVGQSCRKGGISAGAFDLLICAVAIHHEAELVTFDGDFRGIASACDLRVKCLERPA